jgi:protein-S-isoprenylcysteine O-methyltransferase Ste14
MLLGDLPLTVAAAAVWAYWTSVCVLVVRSHLRYRTSAGGLPRTTRERWMWALWVPAIVLWQVFPAVGAVSTSRFWGTPAAALSDPVLLTLRYAAAGLAVAAFGLTIPNWLGMGKNWSMAIVPGKKCRLITSGMFNYVRHPIYALSILLMLSTMAATLTPAMVVIGTIHITMLNLKARSEERFLVQMHGEAYVNYCRRTGRFIPRLRLAHDVDGDDEAVRRAA